VAQPTYTRIASLPAHREATKSFLAIMADVARREGWREAEAFTKWMEFAARSLAGGAFRAALAVERWEENEAAYLGLIKTCRSPGETMADMARALAVVVEALEAEEADFLSPIFSELAAYDEAGQFMTPWTLAEASAQMILADAPGILEQAKAEGRRWISLSEPACGMGGMVLAATKVLKAQGIDPAREAHWHCIDVDWKAVCGSYIQLTLCGVSAQVIHGDALSLETRSSWPTIMAVLFPKWRRATDPKPTPAGPVSPSPGPTSPSEAQAGAPHQFDFGF